jgi:hypothetical protein
VASSSIEESRFRDLRRALAERSGVDHSRNSIPIDDSRDLQARANEKIRIMANWDPSYPGEKVSWYEEYIHRHAPLTISWLQQPRHREDPNHEALEVRGMALYHPPGEPEQTLVVSPLDDGSVCLWDLNGSRGKKGSIVARSPSGLLSVHGNDEPSSRSRKVSTGVVECISVDSEQKKAFVAIQSSTSPPSSREYLMLRTFRSNRNRSRNSATYFTRNIPFFDNRSL